MAQLTCVLIMTLLITGYSDIKVCTVSPHIDVCNDENSEPQAVFVFQGHSCDDVKKDGQKTLTGPWASKMKELFVAHHDDETDRCKCKLKEVDSHEFTVKAAEEEEEEEEEEDYFTVCNWQSCAESYARFYDCLVSKQVDENTLMKFVPIGEEVFDNIFDHWTLEDVQKPEIIPAISNLQSKLKRTGVIWEAASPTKCKVN